MMEKGAQSIYWLGRQASGNHVSELHADWHDVKDSLVELSIIVVDQVIALPKNQKYIQGKTASADLGSGKVEVLSRYVGFVSGNNIVKVRVYEKSKNITIETIRDPNANN